MPITLDGTNGITTPTYGGTDTSEYLVPVTQFKNRIINGAMVIDQRNAGASVSGNNNYTLDRWQALVSASGKYTVQQDAGAVTPPAGFTDYLGVTSSSAYSVSSGDYFTINQRIEGFNMADFAWGTANAKTVTLSFWVRSSLTGTFGGSFRNSASNRSYPYSYTISAANTWEYKTITIAGDTSGTWLTTNGIGIDINFSLGAGSAFSGTAGAWAGSNFFTATGATSVVGTNGATFYITGVQLEVGSTATSFDYRPYGTELALCQRYYYKIAQGKSSGSNPIGTGSYLQAGHLNCVIAFPVSMRTSPTISVVTGTDIYSFFRNGAQDDFNSFTLDISSENYVSVQNTTEVSGTAGQAGVVFTRQNQSAGFLAVTAEL